MPSSEPTSNGHLLRSGGEWNWIHGLSEKAFEATNRCSRVKQLATGETIYRHAQPAEALYQLLSGRVRLYNFSAAGKELLYIYLEPGDCFGELGLIDGRPHHHEATAEGDVSLAVIGKSEMTQLRETFPEINSQLLQLLAKRTRRIYELLEDAFLRDVPRRLAQRICKLGEALQQQQNAAGESLLLHCSHEDLAKMVGSSRQSVTTIMKAWERDGLLRQEYGRLQLLDQAALQQFADS